MNEYRGLPALWPERDRGYDSVRKIGVISISVCMPLIVVVMFAMFYQMIQTQDAKPISDVATARGERRQPDVGARTPGASDWLSRTVFEQQQELSRLRAEIDGLTRSGGVVETLAKHIRRVDGEGYVFREQMASLLSAADVVAAVEDGEIGSVPLPRSRGARHQLVSASSAAAPDVTPHMSDAMNRAFARRQSAPAAVLVDASGDASVETPAAVE